MRIPPDLNGHGGSQRAWRLVEVLSGLGHVHFVLLSRKSDKDAATVSLAPLAAMTASVTSIDIPQWMPIQQEQMPHRRLSADWANLVRMRSHEAPAFSTATLDTIAAQLPLKSADLVFAGRLPSAVILQALMDRACLTAIAKVADLDDIMSNFRARQRQFLGVQRRFLAGVDTWLIQRAERRIATSWDAVSVCTDEDVTALQSAYPTSHPLKVPNVIDRPLLPARADGGPPRLLFVGNLSFFPNVQGLELFLEQAWPGIRTALPDVSLAVVGLHPTEEVAVLADRHGFALYGDVPSVEPYYAACDIVVSPVLVGSGTRIKILEAMAYGRPVVATSLAAEGLGLANGTHLLLADTMAAFAQAVVSLAADPVRREQLAAAARALAIRHYGVGALRTAVQKMISVSRLTSQFLAARVV
jgi:glycosyltransferase involved in cell wall biosynthesis